MMFPEERDFQIADSADQVRHVIRAQEKYGVDVIKILATGGVLSRETVRCSAVQLRGTQSRR
jgi:imidazolonepropionase-like amidohydrolase